MSNERDILSTTNAKMCIGAPSAKRIQHIWFLLTYIKLLRLDRRELLMRHVHYIEKAIQRGEGRLLASGALAVETGKYTGRAAKSRFVIRDNATESTIGWGSANQPIEESEGRRFLNAVKQRLGEIETFQVRRYVGPFPVELITPSAWHAAFADNMFRSEVIESLARQAGTIDAESFGVIRIWHDPHTPANVYGTKSPQDAMIVLDPSNFEVAIAGTAYAGEIKKSAFSMANYLLPITGILPMHASANCLEDGSRSCLIFGLSGTGKTTLSAQEGRYLIGDDEIVWSQNGLSNLEGGCYAKLINLTEKSEPDIFRAVNRFGVILENVVFDEATREPDFSSSERTENTRGSYSMNALSRVFDQSREASEPTAIVFLTADAFGALPAVARLDEWQMRYHFMSGFTAKVAGTEMGLKEPKATFSACFGAPFMPRSPTVYAHLLAKKARDAGASTWLLNTGWIGGYEHGSRFPLEVTRRLLSLIQDGVLDSMPFVRHPIFGFEVPKEAPGVDPKYLRIPEGPQVEMLARKFIENQAQFTDPDACEICARGGPSIGSSRVEQVSIT